MPQDCMDHVRGAHDVPWDVKSTSLEKFVPRGQFGDRCGRSRCWQVIPEYQRIFSCLAISIFR